MKRFRSMRIGACSALVAALCTPLVQSAGCAARCGRCAQAARAQGQPPGGAPSVAPALGRVRALLPPAARASRRLLLGERDPNGPSCVQMPKPGSTDQGVPDLPAGDARGGVGLRFLQFAHWDRTVASPSEEFAWQQKELKAYLRKMAADSRAVSAKLAALQEAVARLRSALAARPEVPADAGSADGTGEAPGGGPAEAGRCGRCLSRIAACLRRGDRPGALRWTDELHGAVLALADLHRWVQFLAENHLASLRMQAVCGEHFRAADPHYAGGRYHPRGHLSRFPGGSSFVDNVSNLFEVERQAEGLFADRAQAAPADAGGRPADDDLRRASLVLPPGLRGAFARLAEVLSPANRPVLLRAALAPYERSFLACALFRAKAAGALGPLAETLRRFDRAHPRPRVWQMMDVLAPRGGLTMSELEWGDRFDPRLMEMAATIKGPTPRQALRQARRVQYGVYGGSKHYRNLVLTLRRALDTGHMDCIRGTDMIGALLRDAGRPGFAYVRVYRGTSGHCIAAILQPPDDAGDHSGAAAPSRPRARPRVDRRSRPAAGGACTVTVVDALFGPGQAIGAWPDYYTTEGRDRGAIAVELRSRGLIGAVFVDGVVLKGRARGRRFTPVVPYLPLIRAPGSSEAARQGAAAPSKPASRGS